jgi:hypothetical protein
MDAYSPPLTSAGSLESSSRGGSLEPHLRAGHVIPYHSVPHSAIARTTVEGLRIAGITSPPGTLAQFAEPGPSGLGAHETGPPPHARHPRSVPASTSPPAPGANSPRSLAARRLAAVSTSTLPASRRPWPSSAPAPLARIFPSV